MRAALPLKLEAQEFPLGVLARLGVGRVAIHDRKEAGPKLSEALLFDGAREELLERAPEALTTFALRELGHEVGREQPGAREGREGFRQFPYDASDEVAHFTPRRGPLVDKIADGRCAAGRDGLGRVEPRGDIGRRGYRLELAQGTTAGTEGLGDFQFQALAMCFVKHVVVPCSDLRQESEELVMHGAHGLANDVRRVPPQPVGELWDNTRREDEDKALDN